MNNSVSNVTSIAIPDLRQLQILSFISKIGYPFIITPICSVGFIFNLISIFVFVRLLSSGKIYKIFLVKALADSFLLLIGSFIFYGSCTSCATYQTLGAVIYKQFFLGFFNAVFSIICFLIPVPFFFANYIKSIGNSKYVLVKTQLGTSIEYTYYLISRNLLPKLMTINESDKSNESNNTCNSNCTQDRKQATTRRLTKMVLTLSKRSDRPSNGNFGVPTSPTHMALLVNSSGRPIRPYLYLKISSERKNFENKSCPIENRICKKKEKLRWVVNFRRILKINYLTVLMSTTWSARTLLYFKDKPVKIQIHL
ncbi:hypothetical protein BpHYR1_015691 [Brachionus plicatilis]|uniref:Uncharacterized protein n=1 Tax=Brachionus plicatilis TaxID=10195 RepID=A0A3M7RFQ0_BRAPC|nr:hypothetical protein BpHYR1_015691 [Brachionus plicatilis]